MNETLTTEELAALPEKQQRNLRAQPEVLAIYQGKPFLEAYAAHTDLRVAQNGYKAAIGADDANWDTHGELQRDFLLSQGLRPEHALLEIGCGTGRLARKVVPYLDRSRYVGIDISEKARANCYELAQREGWAEKNPNFYANAPERLFDFIWAFSVFIHLPAAVVEAVMRRVAGAMHAGSRFFFSYVPEPVAVRSGLKQFRHTVEDYQRACDRAGLTFEPVPDWIKIAGYEPGRWSGNQRVALARLKR